MAISIRSNPNIKGLTFGGRELKLLQMADDTTCFVADGCSARQLLTLFNDFQVVSGLKVNLDKTEGVWLGPPRNDMEGPIPIRWSTGDFKTLGIHFSGDESDSCKDNVVEKIDEIQQLFNIWSMRDLSLIGRILIAKALASTKLLYAMSTTVVTEECLKQAQDIIWKFVWNRKPPKVKKSVMCQKPVDGGLKVIDLSAQAKAMRIMWMKRLWVTGRNRSWVTTLQSMVPAVMITDICLSRGDFSSYTCLMSDFYKLMLTDWLELKSLCVPDTPSTVRKEFIWFNNFIKIEGKALFWKHWYDNGIRFINDIVDTEGNFLLQDQLVMKYGITTNFLECLQLRSAIPFEWKQLLRQPCELLESEHIEATVEVYGREMPVSHLSCKDVYWTLISSAKEVPTAQEKWMQLYPFVPNLDWSSIYSVSYVCSIETKLQAFGFKILHRIVQHKELLFRMGIEESPECPFCDESESIQHKFYWCPRSLLFWQSLSIWWSHNFTHVVLGEQDVLFGLFNRPLENKCLNYIILVGKYYIQIQYSTNRTLMCDRFLKYVITKLKMLKFICTKNGTPFEDCWEHMLSILV